VDQVLHGIELNYANQFSRDEQDACKRDLHACLLEVRALVLAAGDGPLEPESLQRACNAFVSNSKQPLAALSHSLEDAIKRLMNTYSVNPVMDRLINALYLIQQQIQRADRQTLSAAIGSLQLQSWIAPELTRGLYGQDSDEEVFRRVVDRLVSVGFRCVYVCMLEEPQHFDGAGLASIPQKLLLAGYSNRHETKVFSQGKMPVVNLAHPLSTLPGFGEAGAMMGFSFFSGENQYGMLLCEAQVNKAALLHVIGLQLGMLLDFLALRRKETAIATELEAIREKNEILNFLSEYDLMCGILNRRGFIERAIRLNRENIGKTAYCAFIDLDYLKQINDTYGHPEGDIALQAVSGVLQHCVTEYDLIGRIGGDEFVGMFITEQVGFQDAFLACLRRECDRYNQSSGKPYYLDISAGIARFTCQMGLEVSSVIAEADKYLYEAKRSRATNALRLRQGVPKAMKRASPIRRCARPK
jgi:diguanylate cyclase (GGDEF)-like protein